MKNKIKFPYGVSNAEKVVTENYVFIDKTHFIENLEAFDSFVSFLRPRRIGKNFLFLFWNIIMTYAKNINLIKSLEKLILGRIRY